MYCPGGSRASRSSCWLSHWKVRSLGTKYCSRYTETRICFAREPRGLANGTEEPGVPRYERAPSLSFAGSYDHPGPVSAMPVKRTQRKGGENPTRRDERQVSVAIARGCVWPPETGEYAAVEILEQSRALSHPDETHRTVEVRSREHWTR